MARSLKGPVSAGEAERIRKAVPLMMDLVESTMTTVRRIASDLRPSVLDELGVVAATEWQVRRFEARTGIPCTYEADADAPDLDRDRATAAFRILQEILTNVLRHAQASLVQVRIRCHADSFVPRCATTAAASNRTNWRRRGRSACWGCGNAPCSSVET